MMVIGCNEFFYFEDTCFFIGFWYIIGLEHNLCIIKIFHRGCSNLDLTTYKWIFNALSISKMINICEKNINDEQNQPGMIIHFWLFLSSHSFWTIFVPFLIKKLWIVKHIPQKDSKRNTFFPSGHLISSHFWLYELQKGELSTTLSSLFEWFSIPK